MAINLSELKPHKISKNLKGKLIMLYGQPKEGKTTLAAEFEKVLLAAFEVGYNALDDVMIAPIKKWEDWKSVVSQLIRKADLQAQFDTIAMDTVDEAWNACVKYVCLREDVDKIGDIPYGGGYDMAKKEFSGTLRDLAFAGFGIIFISHSTEKTFKDEKGTEYSKIVPALQNRPYDIVNKMVDLIAYIQKEKIQDNSEVGYHYQRFLCLRNTDERFLAGSRYKYIESKIDFSYESLINAVYDAIDKQAKANNSTPSETAESYVRSFDDLMVEAKELTNTIKTKGKTSEALEIITRIFGKPTKFSEMTANDVDKITQVINEIKSLI